MNGVDLASETVETVEAVESSRVAYKTIKGVGVRP